MRVKVSFPRMGTLWVGLKTAFEELGVEVVVPPPLGKRALDLGVQFSPEMACFPFKLCVGNMIEAMERGADTILMAGGTGPCRFGYYGEVQRRILEDLGYNFEMVILEPPQGNWKELAKRIKYVTKGASWLRIWKAVKFGLRKLDALDRLEDLCNRMRPYALEPKAVDLLWSKYLRLIDRAVTRREVERLERRGVEELCSLERRELEEKPLKVMTIGEIYTVLEPLANMHIERRLGEMGCEAHRTIFISQWIRHHVFFNPRSKYHRGLLRTAWSFLKVRAGGHSLESVAHTVEAAREGMDGVVHLMPFTCGPEIVAKGVLEGVRKVYNIPIISFAFDEHTGEAGFLTRLEAFVDLLKFQRRRRAA